MLPGGRPMGSMGAGMPGQNPQGMSEQEQAMVKAVRMKSFLAVLSFCALRKELDTALSILWSASLWITMLT